MTKSNAPDDVSSLTAHVAEFIVNTRYEDVSKEVIQLTKKSILDTLAVALSGSVAPVGDVIRRYIHQMNCSDRMSTVIGSDIKTSPRFAALANGTSMHADDFDDTYQAAPDKAQGLHATAPALAAVLAVAEPEHRNGKDVLMACLVGIEVGSRIFDAAHIDHILMGYHCTGTSGMLGGLAAVARFYGLDVETTRAAISIAATQTGTLMCQLGTMAKPFHSGLAAENAVISADLAKIGLTAAPTVLEMRWGFFDVEGGGWQDERIRGKLGNPWTFVERGQWLKPWPTGSLTHPAFTLMLDFILKHDLKPDDVAHIKVQARQSLYNVLFHHRPRAELEAKFSLEFGLAALLVERDVNLRHFTDEFVLRPDVQENIAKVDFTPFPDDEAIAKGYSLVTTLMEIELKNGKKLEGRIDYGKGSRANPMSDAEVAHKFRDCAVFANWPRAKTDGVIEAVNRLERLKDINEMTRLLLAN
jgi:2-methylcitrate dehydratase PrpD